MEFRLSREDEYPAIRRLWNQSFGAEEPWTSWYFSRHYRADQIWVGVEDGNIIAQAHLLPYRLMLRGAWRDAVYFVGVCVEESLRGTGIGRALMATALAELKRAGVGVSILQPRWPIFYQKLGWDYAYSRQRYSVPVSDAKIQLQHGTLFKAVWKPDEREIDPIASLYDTFVQPRHGYALRERRDWENLLADHRGEGGRVGVLSRNGRPMGYVMYKELEKVLTVREMSWAEPWVVDEAWKFLSGAELAGVESLEWDDPSGDPGSVFYSSTRSIPFLMGRVTELQAILTELEYPADLSVELDLSVTDSLAPWNQGTFHWSISARMATLLPASPGVSAGLALDIGAISQMVFGERPMGEILAAGKGINCNETERQILERIFPSCRNYISEYY